MRHDSSLSYNVIYEKEKMVTRYHLNPKMMNSTLLFHIVEQNKRHKA